MSPRKETGCAIGEPRIFTCKGDDMVASGGQMPKGIEIILVMLCKKEPWKDCPFDL